MLELLELLAWALITAGIGFFSAGTVALIRFPDTLTRLHALTKADNLGLGLLALGLALRAKTIELAGLYLLTWLLVLIASGPLSALLGTAALSTSALREGDEP